jgi:hypothetical protein
MAYDNRKPGESTVAAWQEAAERSRWTFDEAREAIYQHYANSTEFLMPGHITAAIRAARRQPTPVQLLPRSADGPAQPDRIRDLIHDIAALLGWPDRAPEDSPALRYPCPHCGAVIGKRCSRQLARGTRRGQFVPIANPHSSRVDLIQETP